MDRRAFVSGVTLGLLAAPFAAEGQQAGKVYRIGLLGTVPLTEAGAARIWGGLFDGLHQLGYTAGQNIAFEGRFSEGIQERLPALAVELVRLNVDVIVAAANAAEAAKGATSTIPIVVPNYGDPVETRLVVSLARPGGNVTGLSGPDLVAKQLQLLKEVMPRLSHVAVLSNPTHPGHPHRRREAEDAARSLRVRLQILEARAPTELARAISAADRSANGLVVLGDPMFFGERAQIVELAAKNRLPVIAIQAEYSQAGGLLSYGIDQRDTFRRAAIYVDKILKGAKPADLPVEQPTKFDLVVNLKTAKALGLTIPPALLQRADQVIE
jgi:putative tryptophan/tyrosine transport system substrate-binding protein